MENNCILCGATCVCISGDPEEEDSLWECTNSNCHEDYEKNKKQINDTIFSTHNDECEVEFFRCDDDEDVGLTINTPDGQCLDIFINKAQLLAALK